ncbi:MAG: TIGR04282 family arsenosugar biosynthesis glycosyltransferase, partial [Nevskiaceae bacterium]
APEPGRCKTRLIPALGPHGAAALHRRLVRRTLIAAAAAGHEVELWCTPHTAHGFFAACRREFGVRLRRQPAGDLGRRMALALARALREGADAAVLAGSDCPDFTPIDFAGALAALDAHDCVLQPSRDGGYVLIGARRLERRALAGIAWSSARELAQTRRRLAALDFGWRELRTLEDVDTPADYRRARRAGLL